MGKVLHLFKGTPMQEQPSQEQPQERPKKDYSYVRDLPQEEMTRTFKQLQREMIKRGLLPGYRLKDKGDA